MPAAAPLVRTARVAALLTLGIAVIVFAGGWVLDVPALRNIVPGTVQMKSLTALGLGMAASSLLLMADAGDRRRRTAGRLLAAGIVLLGAAVLSEYLLGWRLGIDELLFRDSAGRALHIAYPGRFAPTTGVSFVLCGLALLTLDVHPRGAWRPSELLIVPVGAVAVMTIVGYLYAIPAFYGPASAAKMALNSGLAFLSLTGGVLFARPRGRLVRLALTDDPGGVMMRRLLPLAVVLPLLLGWARLQAGEAGWFGNRVGTWWLSATTIAVLVLVIGRSAARLSRAAQAQLSLEAELHQLANHDALTGLFNRRRFDEDLAAAAARAARHGEPCSLVLLDFDRMKRVNDELGHAAGDALLEAVGTLLTGRLRASDAAGRLGGDEFAVLLPGTPPQDAALLGEQLRSAIRELRPSGAQQGAWTTVSIGVAPVGPLGGADEAHREADLAMYVAKRAGGDRVHVHAPGPAPLEVLV